MSLFCDNPKHYSNDLLPYFLCSKDLSLIFAIRTRLKPRITVIMFEMIFFKMILISQLMEKISGNTLKWMKKFLRNKF